MVENDKPDGTLEPEQDQDDGVFRIKRSALYSLLLPLALVTGLAIGYLLWGQQSQPAVVVQNPVTTEEQGAIVVDEPTAQPSAPDLREQQGQIRLEVSEDDDAVLGPD
ncbi:MAG: hypothetical protein PVI04_05845, partial [Anaerolineales bacterium]